MSKWTWWKAAASRPLPQMILGSGETLADRIPGYQSISSVLIHNGRLDPPEGRID